MWAVRNLDGDGEDFVELSSHDGCFSRFLGLFFCCWPYYSANVSLSTSQLSESTFSHHVCHDVVNNRRGIMKSIKLQGNVERTQRRCVTLTSWTLLGSMISVFTYLSFCSGRTSPVCRRRRLKQSVWFVSAVLSTVTSQKGGLMVWFLDGAGSCPKCHEMVNWCHTNITSLDKRINGRFKKNV